MGGTFDPIHHGHLVAASEVGSFFGLDEVIFVPTGEPWQKEQSAVSAAEHPAMIIDLPRGKRLSVFAAASPALVTAALKALR